MNNNNANTGDIKKISDYISDKKTLIYCRVSTIQQTGLNHVSFEMQETKGNICAKIFNLNVYMVFKVVESAYQNDYKTIKKLIKEYKNKNIIIYNVTRLCRNYKAGLELLNLALQHNTRLFFVNEGIVWDKHNKDNLILLKKYLEVAENESKVIGKRIKDAISEKKRRGYLISKAPYGFKAVAVDGGKKAFPEEYEQKVIKFINACKKIGTNKNTLNEYMKNISPNFDEPICLFYRDVETDKIKYPMSNGEIARLLNSYNVLKRGKAWTTQSLASIMKRDYNNFVDKFSKVDLK